MPKIYKYGDKKSKNLSEYEAHKLINEIPEEEKKEPLKYQLARTEKGAIWGTNRKQRTKYSFKIRRLCALLAQKYNQNVLYDKDKNIIYANNKSFIIADRVQSEEEKEYHLNKYDIDNKEIISLTKSTFVPYFILDTKTIKEYYEKEFKFPDWFRPFLKHRSFRVMNIQNSFAFASRRYNDTSKWKAEDKFVNDLVRKNVFGDPGKIYFTLSRMLDSKLDRKGEGYPIENLVLLVLDVDGSCDGIHEINDKGICVKCMADAFRKEKIVKRKLLESKYPYPTKTLFSGGKGLHLHFEKEVKKEYIKEMIDFLNEDEELIDYFNDKDGNFDSFRIFKVPDSCSAETACLIKEEIERLQVKDKICEPERR